MTQMSSHLPNSPLKLCSQEPLYKTNDFMVVPPGRLQRCSRDGTLVCEGHHHLPGQTAPETPMARAEQRRGVCEGVE